VPPSTRSPQYTKSLVFLTTIIGFFAVSAGAQPPANHPGLPSLNPTQQAEMLLLSGKFEEAIQAYQKLWEEDEINSYAIRGLVRAYWAAGQSKDLKKYLNRFLSEHPDSSSARYGLGFTFYLDKRFYESEKILREVLEQNPENALALNTLGAVLVHLKSLDEAVQRVKEAIAIDPSELMFYRNLYSIYSKGDRTGIFLKEYQEHLKKGKRQVAFGYGSIFAQNLRQRSFRLYSDGNVPGAIEKILAMVDIYREIEHTPGLVAGLFSLGLLYEERGEVERSRENYRNVLKINPNHIQAREKVRQFEVEKK